VYKVHFLCAEFRQTQTQVVADNRKRVAITPRLHVREIPKQDTQTSRQYSPVVTGEVVFSLGAWHRGKRIPIQLQPCADIG
jgi:hypothetical protein